MAVASVQKTIAPVIIAAFWGAWLLIGVLLQAGHSFDSKFDLQQLGFFLAIHAAGVALSIAFWKRKHRALALFLLLLSLLAFWKFFFGAIFARTLPQFGGYTFRGALLEWWHFNTTSVFQFIKAVPYVASLLFSIFYWTLSAASFHTKNSSTAV